MDYSIVPNPKTQSKMEFYYSPYNRTLGCGKFMNFESERSSRDSKDSQQGRSKKKWKKVADLILNEKYEFGEVDFFAKHINQMRRVIHY
jgi:hypothetical protein